MPTIDELQSWIWSYQRTVNNCDSQIKRLDAVYKELGSIEKLHDSNRKNTKSFFKEKGTWRGDRHTAFCRTGEELDSILGDYYKQLDVARDAINIQMAKLKAKKWEMIPLINRWSAQIENMKAEAKNALN